MAKTSLQLLLLVTLITRWPIANAGECYFRGWPLCGLLTQCGDDHFMYFKFTWTCLISPDKYCCPAGPHNDIVLCEHKDLSGNCIAQSLQARECVTVEKNDWASSAKVFGNCFRLFEHDKCQGRSKAIFADGPGVNNFEEIGMNDMVSSMSVCSENDHCPARRSKRSSNNHNCRFFTDFVTVGFIAWLSRDRNNLSGPVRYYQTSGPQDRTEVMEAEIERHHLNTGTVTRSASTAYARRLGRPNDHAGHILARQLGGSGTDLRNIFPQYPNFNQGVWSAEVESWVAQLVRDHGWVRFTVNLFYETNEDTRPTQIVYRIEWVENGVPRVFVGDLLNP